MPQDLQSPVDSNSASSSNDKPSGCLRQLRAKTLEPLVGSVRVPTRDSEFNGHTYYGYGQRIVCSTCSLTLFDEQNSATEYGPK